MESRIGRLFSNVLGAIALCAVSSACHNTLVPKTPRIAQRAPYDVELTSMDQSIWSDLVGGALEITVRFHSIPKDAKLVEAFFTRGKSEACSSGYVTKAIAVVDGPPFTGGDMLPVPSHEVRFDFPTKAYRTLLEGPTRLDILIHERIGTIKCIEIPVVQDAKGYEWDQQLTWTIAWVLAADAYIKHLEGLQAAYTFPLRIGKRIDPVHLSLDVGIGGTECDQHTCATHETKDDDDKESEDVFFPFAFAAQVDLFQVSFIGMAIGARYRFGVTFADTYEGKNTIVLHGPALVPVIFFGEPDPYIPGVPGGPETGFLIGLGMPIGFLMADSGARSFTLGAELVMQFPLM